MEKLLRTKLWVGALIFLFAISAQASEKKWLFQELSTEQGLNSITFIDDETAWAVGFHGIKVYSEDSGENWQRQDFGNDNFVYYDVTFSDSQNGWVVGTSGTIQHTDDGGEVWQTQEIQFSETLVDVTFIDDQKGWTVGGGSVLYTQDGGENWDFSATPNFERSWHGISMVDEETGWVVGQNGTVIYTQDGYDWQYQGSVADETLVDVTFIDELTGWAAGYEGTIVHTEDGGENWVTQDSGVEDYLHKIIFTDSETGWAFNNSGKVLHTTDGGDNWEVDYDPDNVTRKTRDVNGLTLDEDGIFWAVGGSGLSGHGSIIRYTEIHPEITDWAPLYNSVDVEPEILLEWSESESAEGYNVQLAEDADFSELVVDEENLDNSEFQVSDLEGEELYYWRVKGIDDGYGWSEPLLFRTEEFIPGVIFSVDMSVQQENGFYKPDVGDEVEVVNEWGESFDEPIYLEIDAEKDDYPIFTGKGEFDRQEGAEVAYRFRLVPGDDRELENGGVEILGDNAELSAQRYFTFEDSDKNQVLETKYFGGEPFSRDALSEWYPEDDAEDISSDVVMEWSEAGLAETYQLMVAEDQDFENIKINETDLEATQFEVAELEDNSTYYWSVNVYYGDTEDDNWLGNSETLSFTTGEDEEPRTELTEPDPADGAEDIETDLTVSWGADERADTYHFQLAEDEEFEVVIEDEEGLEATEIEVNELQGGTTYHWRLEANNSNGGLGWSSVASFSTKELVSAEPGTEVPDDYALNGNYPNPFNPTTVISYQLPEAGHVRLEVYDVMGRRVAVLVDEPTGAGSHEVSFDASEFSSGTYIYRIEAGSFVDSRIMMFVK